MKKIAIILLFLCVFTSGIGAKKYAVSMETYEQTSTDSEGTISLKNNTKEDVHNVSFMLEYLDMNGKPLDYKIFDYNIDIAPGMTRQLNIPAYQRDRFYHYYKSDGFEKAFKVRYELKEYNLSNNEVQIEGTDTIIEGTDTIEVPEEDETESDKRSSPVFPVLIMILALPLVVPLVVLGIFCGAFVLVAVMAQKRNRNPVIWLLLSLAITPIAVCIILYFLGNDKSSLRG